MNKRNQIPLPASYDRIIVEAETLLPSFAPIARETPYELLGILYSEALFLLGCLRTVPQVTRLLESGTARGQSTVLFARALPHMHIETIEYDTSSPNVAIADIRLKPYQNVTRVFGDSRAELPRRIGPDAAVIIDGPKMFLAIRLALKLLATGQVAGVFIHDMLVGTPEREFLNRFFDEARFSDYRPYAERTHKLDAPAASVLYPHMQMGGFSGDYGYGFALAWLPYVPGRSYQLLHAFSFIYDALAKPKAITARVWRKLLAP